MARVSTSRRMSLVVGLELMRLRMKSRLWVRTLIRAVMMMIWLIERCNRFWDQDQSQRY